MKKVIYVFLVGMFCLLLGVKNAYAKIPKLDAYINLDDNCAFNVFREFNNSTKLAQFLFEHGYNILEDLKSIGFSETGEKYDTVNTVFINHVDFDSDVTFILANLSAIVINKDIKRYEFNTDYHTSYYYVIVYDKDMNLKTVELYNNNTSHPDYKNIKEYLNDFNYNDDLTQLISQVYFTLENSVTLRSFDYDKINISQVFQDTKYKFFDDINWFEYLKFLVLESLHLGPNYMEQWKYSANFDLTYYKENSLPLGGSYKSIGSLLFMEQEIEIPSGYESFTMNGTDDVYFLTYKGNKNVDSKVYYYSNFSDSKFFTSAYNLSIDGLTPIKDMVITTPKSSMIYNFEPKEMYEVSSLDNLAIMLYPNDRKYQYTIFYDPEAYSLTKRQKGSSEDFTLTNNSGSYTISASTFEKIWYQSNNNNTNKPNEDNSSGSGSGFDFSAGTILNGFKNFIGAVSGISSAIGSFFEHMPSDLVQLLFAGFSMGMVALVIKIIL